MLMQLYNQVHAALTDEWQDKHQIRQRMIEQGVPDPPDFMTLGTPLRMLVHNGKAETAWQKDTPEELLAARGGNRVAVYRRKSRP